MSRTVAHLTRHGYAPIVLSETATELSLAGCPPHGTWRYTTDFQDVVLLYQLQREQTYRTIANRYKVQQPRVVLCDRGTLDGRAYTSAEAWEYLMREHHTTLHDQMIRYDLVIHLVTAADGAEEYYSLENNPARTEPPELARTVDRALRRAWSGHDHHRIIDNTTDFDTKIRTALTTLGRRLTMPDPYEHERKFLATQEVLATLPPDAVSAIITQTYLTRLAPDEERRVRRRTCLNGTHYTLTTKQPTSRPGVRIERERLITREEYLTLLREADTNHVTIHKTRWCFVHDGRVCELDLFHTGKLAGQVMLEIELPDIDTPVVLPPGSYTEVTGDPQYTNASLAQRL